MRTGDRFVWVSEDNCGIAGTSDLRGQTGTILKVGARGGSYRIAFDRLVSHTSNNDWLCLDFHIAPLHPPHLIETLLP